MWSFRFGRRAFGIGLAVAFLAGCGQAGVPMPMGNAQTARRGSKPSDSKHNRWDCKSGRQCSERYGLFIKALGERALSPFRPFFRWLCGDFVTATQNSAAFASGRQIGCTPRFNVLFAVFGSRSESGFRITE